MVDWAGTNRAEPYGVTIIASPKSRHCPRQLAARFFLLGQLSCIEPGRTLWCNDYIQPQVPPLSAARPPDRLFHGWRTEQKRTGQNPMVLRFYPGPSLAIVRGDSPPLSGRRLRRWPSKPSARQRSRPGQSGQPDTSGRKRRRWRSGRRAGSCSCQPACPRRCTP